MMWVSILVAIVLTLPSISAVEARDALEPSQIERGLEIVPHRGGASTRLDLSQALASLKIHSVSIALIDRERLLWARAWGEASLQTLYQAASLSKLVTAVAALRLVEQGQLNLDRNVNDDLTIWRAPENDLTAGHPVTLRGLLSMRAGVNVPGYPGYEPGAPLPNLAQILNGAPPANSPPVRVVETPGSHYAYSGGGYEVVQALIEAKTKKPFEETLHDLVFRPVGMTNSFFLQPLPTPLAARCGARTLCRWPHFARRFAHHPGTCCRRPVVNADGSRQTFDSTRAVLSRGRWGAYGSKDSDRNDVSSIWRPLWTWRRGGRVWAQPRSYEARTKHRLSIIYADLSEDGPGHCRDDGL